jgi:uncharacterized membrane protein
MDAHHRVIIGVIATATVGFFLRIHPFWTASLAAYDAFAFANLSLIWVAVALTPFEQIPLVAQRQDAGRTIIFVVVIIAACAALFAVAFLIRAGKPEHHFTRHLLLALVTVVLS